MVTRGRQGSIHRLEFEVGWQPGHVACYFIDGPEPILVDAAIPHADPSFEAALSDSGRSLDEVKHLLITHPHVDHIGGVPDVLRATDSTVYAPASVRERFGRDPDSLGERVRRNCLDAGFSGERLETIVGMAVRSLERNVELLDPQNVDVWIEPGDTITIGDIAIDSVHLPGHQADHLSYTTELEGETIFLSGDMGILPFRPVVMHDGLDDGFRDAFAAFYEALDRMTALEVDCVYPGHGPVHDDLPSVVERHRSSLDHRLDCLVDLISNGNETAPSLAEKIAHDHDINHLIPEAMSALAHLESTDRISSELTGGVKRYRL